MSSAAAVPHDSTRHRILAVAFDVFAERGYVGTSTREICRRADVNGAALNYHWRSKELLWLAVCQLCSERLLARVSESLQLGSDPKENVDALIHAVFDALVADPRPARIVAWSSLQAEALDFEATEKTFAPLVSSGLDLIRRASTNASSDDDLEAVVALLYGQVLFSFVDQAGHRLFFGRDFSDPAHAARIKSQVLRQARLLLGNSEAPKSRPRRKS